MAAQEPRKETASAWGKGVSGRPDISGGMAHSVQEAQTDALPQRVYGYYRLSMRFARHTVKWGDRRQRMAARRKSARRARAAADRDVAIDGGCSGRATCQVARMLALLLPSSSSPRTQVQTMDVSFLLSTMIIPLNGRYLCLPCQFSRLRLASGRTAPCELFSGRRSG